MQFNLESMFKFVLLITKVILALNWRVKKFESPCQVQAWVLTWECNEKRDAGLRRQSYALSKYPFFLLSLIPKMNFEPEIICLLNDWLLYTLCHFYLQTTGNPSKVKFDIFFLGIHTKPYQKQTFFKKILRYFLNLLFLAKF